MRTVNKVGGANGTIFTEFYGNTTDVKPTEDVPNGSAFYEVDNNMQEYRFDKENKIWYSITRGGTAPSDEYLPLSGGIMTGDINMNGNSLLNAKFICANDNTDINKVKYISGLSPTNIFINNYNIVGYNLVGINISENAFTFYSNDKNNKHSQIEIIYNVEDNLPRLSFKAGYNDRINLPVLLKGVDTPVDDTDAANKQYVDQETTKYLPLTGGKMTGNINFNNKSIYGIFDMTFNPDVQLRSGVGNNRNYLQVVRAGTDNKLSIKAADAVEDDELVTKSQMEIADSKYLPLTGTTEDNPVTGVVTFNGESTITGVSTPVNDTDVVTKKYADDIKTELDDKTNQIKEDTTALQKRQNVLVGSETGNPVSVDDAFSSPLCGLTIYGKSTQDGTPSPDAPVPIVSAGEDGSVTVKVTGRNILDMRNSKESVTNSGVTYTRNADYSFTRTGTATEVTGNAWIAGDYLVKPKADLSNVFCVLLKGVKYSIKDCVLLTVSPTGNVLVAHNENFVPTQDMYITGVRNEDFIKGETYNDIVYPAVYVGEKALQYEPYRGQLLTIPTPNGLPGIPVTSGGNYTDENGQQWVCDEVDLKRGKYTQRVAIENINGGWNLKPSSVMLGKFLQNKLTNTFQNGTKTAVCNIASFNIWGDTANDKYIFALNARVIYFSPPKDTEITVEELNAKLNSLSFPVVVVGELATPIERDLTPEEIVAYKALTAYGPDTVVQATDGVGLKLNYQRDVNIVIKNLEYAIASMTTT